jgi:hypothetical protein
VHLPTGIRLDGSVGIAGHYRVFTANRRYGTAAWDWPSTAELLPDGSVQTTWPEASDRPFEMTAHYRWAAPQVLDVVTTVAARENLSGFESFFASYLNEAFPTPYAWARSEEPRTQSHFLRGDKNYGDWLMFISPGDPRADVIQDGRWLLDPHPVKWTVLPRLDAPLCLSRNENPKLAVLVMAPREDCFTVAMPHEGESHYSLYLSLFGRNVKAGETATARARLIVAGDVSDEQALELYDRYLKSLGERRTRGDGRSGLASRSQPGVQVGRDEFVVGQMRIAADDLVDPLDLARAEPLGTVQDPDVTQQTLTFQDVGDAGDTAHEGVGGVEDRLVCEGHLSGQGQQVRGTGPPVRRISLTTAKCSTARLVQQAHWPSNPPTMRSETSPRGAWKTNGVSRSIRMLSSLPV